MHEDVAAKDKGVRVYLRDDATAGGANVGKKTVGFGVFAKRLEIEIVERGALRFVERRTGTGYMLKVRGGSFGIPWSFMSRTYGGKSA